MSKIYISLFVLALIYIFACKVSDPSDVVSKCTFPDNCPSPCTDSIPEYVPGQMLIINPMGSGSLSLEQHSKAITTLICEYAETKGQIKYDSLINEGWSKDSIRDMVYDSFQPLLGCQCNGSMLRVENDFLFGIETGVAEHANSTQVPEIPDGIFSPNHYFDNTELIPPNSIARLLLKNPIVSNALLPFSGKKIRESTVAIIDNGIFENIIANGNRHINQSFASTPASLNNEFGINVLDWSHNVNNLNHGALVAQTIMLSLNKYVQSQDVWSRIKVLPIQAMDECGVGTAFDIGCAMYCAKNEGANVINMSLGNYVKSDVIELAVQEVTDGKRLIVASAGNRKDDLSLVEHYPSAYSDASQFSSNISSFVIEVGSICDFYDSWNSTATGLLDISNFRNRMTVTGGVFVDLDKCSYMGTSVSSAKVAANALLQNIYGVVPSNQKLNLSQGSTIITDGNREYYMVN